MRRLALLLVPAAAVSAALVLSAGGSAQAPDGRTLTFFEDASRETTKLIDNVPKSPTSNPGSPRFSLSLGDEGAARTPVLDSRGGTRIGAAYSQGTVVKGRNFRNAVISGQIVYALADGDIVASGVVRNNKRTQTFAVTGGTRAYEGARGSITSTEQGGGSLDSVHLLP